eukprot:GHVH01001508.1.p1 GENE.GHVH01001508.1~~GHVH01001508.1.p1  ORF type:complete len:615 (-),score=69.50 GHVH01001508.1:78-1922(-)
MTAYTDMTVLTQIDSEVAPPDLIQNTPRNSKGPSHVRSGFEASTFLLPTPRAGIELINEEYDDMIWGESGSFDSESRQFDIEMHQVPPGGEDRDFLPVAGGLDSPFIPLNTSTAEVEVNPPFYLRPLLNWMRNLSLDGLSYTERGTYKLRDVEENIGEPRFYDEAVHGASPQTQYMHSPSNNFTSEKYGNSYNQGIANRGLVTTSRLPQGPVVNSNVLDKDQLSSVGTKKKRSKSENTHKKSKKKKKNSFGSGILRLLGDFWPLTTLISFVPLGIASAYLHWSDCTTFCLNFMAIVPMAWLIGQCTEDVASKLGQVYGGLVNAWMGNVVEMVLVVAALKHNEVVVVRATLIGSILSNILLVAGCAFFFGGLKYKEQEFSTASAGILSSLLMLSVLCLGLPTVYNTVLDKADADLLNISRVLSFFLIIVYAEFMFFQLFTHAYLFADDDDDDEEEYLSLPEALLLLTLTSIVCTICSEYLVRSIDGTVKALNLSKEFIGIILLPIIGNAAEHYTAVVVSLKNKMDLSVGCAIGSSVQMALLVTPFSVLTGWAMGVPMTLDLHPYELMVLIASILTVQTIINDGKTNWLEGALLCTAYTAISIIYFLEDPKYSDVL